MSDPEAPRRRPIAKKLRFDVFKRDSFKCQYCGASAPEVLLHLDHISPVVQGGTNEITNLITACDACNLGKGARPLSDNSAVSKQRAQLEQLQERQEQLEMMMEWQRGLLELKGRTVDELAEFWEDHAPGWSMNDNGKTKIKRWLRTYNLGEITEAMNIAAEQYLRRDPDDQGVVTRESWEIAFKKVPAICRVASDAKDNPDLKELFYIRGILRNRLSYMKDKEAIDWLKAARSWEVPIEELRNIALSVTSWSRFSDSIDDVIARQRRALGQDNED